MATPRIFVSSTCYDLKYIRENLKFFVRIKVTPYLILKNKTLDEVTDDKIVIEEKDEHVVYGGIGCRLTRGAYNANSRHYTQLRTHLIEILKENGMTLKEYLAQEQK